MHYIKRLHTSIHRVRPGGRRKRRPPGHRPPITVARRSSDIGIQANRRSNIQSVIRGVVVCWSTRIGCALDVADRRRRR
jgi:hypothetical protein